VGWWVGEERGDFWRVVGGWRVTIPYLAQCEVFDVEAQHTPTMPHEAKSGCQWRKESTTQKKERDRGRGRRRIRCQSGKGKGRYINLSIIDETRQRKGEQIKCNPHGCTMFVLKGTYSKANNVDVKL
jgi:hypothetical protein